MKATLMFALGIIARSFWGTLATIVIKYLLTEVRYWPMVDHYLRDHEGKAKHCHDCALGNPMKVDGIN